MPIYKYIWAHFAKGKRRGLLNTKELRKKSKRSPKFDPIHLGPEDWPVVQMAKNRKTFIDQVSKISYERVLEQRPSITSLIEELEVTRFKEHRRIKEMPWKVDPEDELQFWQNIKSSLVDIEQSNDEHFKDKVGKNALSKIVNRYTNEIAGNFKPSHYKLARQLVTFWFSRLLNASRLKGITSFWSNQYSLRDKIQLVGELEHIRKLAKLGTVVIVPTHFSNLDSVTIGWAISELGLPPFIYGAGLNLFNIDVFAYFMNSLGAYKVDRRKKNLIYLETLKNYSTLALRNGCHSLFFPGGTRSRSGKIEKKLKLGLLGTAIEAQRLNYVEGGTDRSKKIFVFPVVLNYNFVLEAPILISDYLESKGQERYYVEHDHYTQSNKILKFLNKFFTKGSNISISIGRGMDLFGNYVDDEGRSIDKNGFHVNTRDYYMHKGQITKDLQRDEEYTRRLSNIIVEEYHKINRVFASHLAPFVAFQMIRKKHIKLDFYSVLRLPLDEIEIPYPEFREVFGRLRDEIFKLKDKGKLDVAEHLTGDLDQVIRLGVENVGMYHSRRPVLFNKAGNITSMDISTLYYYHNRMDGYELEKFI